jgi:TRAP-type C4-dicarboxylate transport system permease small subunit
VETATAGALVALIVLLILAQIVSRKVFGRPLVWSEELCVHAFMAVTMLGGAAATARHSHIRLSLLLDRLPNRTTIERCLDWVAALALAGAVPPAIRLTETVHRIGVLAPATRLPMALIYALAPLALCLFVFHLCAGPETGSAEADDGPAIEGSA